MHQFDLKLILYLYALEYDDSRNVSLMMSSWAISTRHMTNTKEDNGMTYNRRNQPFFIDESADVSTTNLLSFLPIFTEQYMVGETVGC